MFGWKDVIPRRGMDILLHNYTVFLEAVVILIYDITSMAMNRKQDLKLKTLTYISKLSLEHQNISDTNNLATVGL
jgi:hypothetical protein